MWCYDVCDVMCDLWCDLQVARGPHLPCQVRLS